LTLLIIPAAAARPLAKTPEAMALIAAPIGRVAALGGLGVSFELDTQTGPTIITITAAVFFATNFILRMFVGKT
jgi:zinc transport system permease protein